MTAIIYLYRNIFTRSPGSSARRCWRKRERFQNWVPALDV
jgi:hypothetical protein